MSSRRLRLLGRLWLAALVAGQAAAAPTPRRPSGKLVVSELRQRYGLEVSTAGAPFPVETQHGRIEGADAEPADVESFLRILGPEWGAYPPALIRRTGLRRIILCRDLSFAGQKRTADPDFEHLDLYFDMARGRKDPNYVRKVIHHEYYHLIDWQDDGKLYEDALWTALNAPGFRYGDGEVNAQDDARGSVLDDMLPGFLNSYSMAGVEEDKAEVFANLLVSPLYVAGRCRNDPVLRLKVLRIQLLMWRFAPELDLEFWSRPAHPPPAE